MVLHRGSETRQANVVLEWTRLDFILSINLTREHVDIVISAAGITVLIIISIIDVILSLYLYH